MKLTIFVWNIELDKYLATETVNTAKAFTRLKMYRSLGRKAYATNK